MANLTGQEIRNTYQGLLKTDDNDALAASEKAITDGLGNISAISLSTDNLQITGGLKDSTGDLGAPGQFLSSTGLNVDWVDVVIPAGVFETGSGTGSIQSVLGGATASGLYSFAVGDGSTASGEYTGAFSGGQALGGRSIATQTGSANGNSSIAIGYASRAGVTDGGSPYGDGQIAIGTNSYAQGQASVAIGTSFSGNTTASGYAIAFGVSATATGTYSIAFAYSTASGDSSVAINGGTASGYYAVAISSGLSPCEASGDQSFAIGVSCQATAAFSGVLGGGVAAHTSAICINANSNRDNAVFVNQLSITNIPTSATGLPSGAVWNDGGFLKIV